MSENIGEKKEVKKTKEKKFTFQYLTRIAVINVIMLLGLAIGVMFSATDNLTQGLSGAVLWVSISVLLFLLGKKYGDEDEILGVFLDKRMVPSTFNNKAMAFSYKKSVLLPLISISPMILLYFIVLITKNHIIKTIVMFYLMPQSLLFSGLSAIERAVRLAEGYFANFAIIYSAMFLLIIIIFGTGYIAGGRSRMQAESMEKYKNKNSGRDW